MIELKQISKKFNKNEIFSNLNLTMEDGFVYGIVGPNGAGKSTLLRLIAGILESDEGEVLINGQSFHDDHRIRKDIIYVSDDPYFFGMNTLKELRQFYRIFFTNFNETTFYRLLSNFQVDEKARLVSFSKGMRRQVSLILGLSLEPRILLLDEAFDGLDPVMRLNLIRYLNIQVAENKLTVLLSSHNVRELEEICDQVYLLYKNKINKLSYSDEEARTLVHYELIFDKPVNLKEVERLASLVDYNLDNKDLKIVFNSEVQSIDEINELLQPLSSRQLSMNLEDLFIYSLKEQGYGNPI